MSNLIVYNASAGSGKTYTLAVEFISLCLKEKNPHYFRHILAITFTNKAAHELKERIILFTQELGSGQASSSLIDQVKKKVKLDDSAIKNRSQRIHELMLFQYSDLHISTIDSFVLGILRSFSKELGLPFDFDVELDYDKVKDLLVSTLLDAIGKDSFLTEQLVTWSTQNLDEDKTWNPKQQMKNALELLSKEESIPYRRKLVNLTKIDLANKLEDLNSRRNEILSSISDIQSEVSALLRRTNLDLDDFNNKRGGFISFTYKDYNREKLPTDKHISTVSSRNLVSGDGRKAGKEHLAESIRDDLIHSIKRVRSLGEELQRLNLFHRNRMSLILALQMEILIDDLEKEEGMSILQDNNAKVSKLISNNPTPFIYERVGERFKHYLIDEFQDTSVLQWRNMLPLIENSLSVGKKNFLVGDAKQSIYRWRGGEVDQLMEIPRIPGSENNQRLKEFESSIQNNFRESISLKKNYRSARSIIEFNNQLFKFLSSDLSEKYKRCYTDVDQEVTKEEIGHVTMKLLPEKSKLEDTLDWMHSEIESCIEDGYSGEDICLLVRRNRDGRIIAKSLEEKGYKVSSPDALLLAGHADVYLLISLLSFLSGAENTKYILFAIHRLLEIADRDKELVHWYSIFQNQGSTVTISKLMIALEKKWDITSLMNKEPYGALISLIEILDLERNDAYIQELLNQATGFGTSRESTMIGFIAYWEDMKGKLSVKAGRDKDNIQVMTIHKSKGLQFPVVLMPIIDWNSMKKGKSKVWIESEEAPISIALINLNEDLRGTAYERHLLDEISKSKLDTLNLLYVAFTRAEDRMYIQVTDPKRPGIAKSLTEYIQKQGADGMVELGERVLNPRKPEENAQSSVIRTFEKSRKEDLLSVALSKEGRNRAKREFGKVVHSLIEKCMVQESISKELDKHLPSSIIAPEERQEAVMAVENAITLELSLGIDVNQYEIYHEIELLDPKGSTHRIDKLFLDRNSQRAKIIDYKTGEKSANDVKQIDRYKELLLDMEIFDVEAFLLYTGSSEVVKI
ncbi:MAG: UvrD-helicase domain-containing protein [Flavobacteriales bacterium]|nr:UvrD-helicase domain-containing protein [Flavobacteriales bacterium]NNK80737.1 UvrD-helicase domain-containing protein [Flavobacteriales bacterium]